MTVVTLTTDFGTSDGYVGTMKGVILSLAPDAALVDITHDIAPPSKDGLRQNIRQAAYVLYAAAPYLPRGTVHLAVVDPGVGSDRRALAIRTKNEFLVGPDNGLFTLFLADEPDAECYTITNARYVLPHISTTFHGRDIFAPGLHTWRVGWILQSLAHASITRWHSRFPYQFSNRTEVGTAACSMPIILATSLRP